MNYTEAVAYINEIPKFTKKNKFDHTVEMMRRLGHPERTMKIIHVAGTNGKGSVCAFLSSILVHAGKRTGLFTSPHLVKINERFQVNHEQATDEEFLAAFQEVMETVKGMQADGLPHPTYFELLYALGMVFFAKKQVEYCVLETGLGGRLDATNTVEHPIASVITSISLDHTEYLGNTIPEIAGEKAGIIKPGVPVIYDGRDAQAEAVIRRRAEELDSPATGLHEGMYEVFLKSDKSIDFSLNFGYYENAKITVPYLAEYQVVNSSLALLAMEVIDPQHTIPLETRLQAIRDTRWQGRMETVLPGVVLDGAHNADGVAQFVKTVQGLPKDRRVVMLFSAVVEKNFEKMIETICTQTNLSAVVVTEIPGSRNEPAKELGRIFETYTDAPVTVVPEIEEAFQEALRQKEDGMLFCVGSLYLVGELKRILSEKEMHG
ncbi:MAG: folylpolyglutamate synthase/dihydrofolate synthase family protein [Eubacteriales bacterium]|nr:folylpolyglutamate synthase/dihydrofolate synthase family protein [Eubacteriales bacterium]